MKPFETIGTTETSKKEANSIENKLSMNKTLYDLVIIGAGPVGYKAAERAGQAGMRAILFDKQYLGGVCLNEGCIPTKTLLYTAKLYEAAKEGTKYGIHAENVSYDFSAIMKRKDKVVSKPVGGVGSALRKSGVEIVYGAAMMIENEMRIQDMEEIIFPHPTVSEILRETVFAFRG